MVTIMQIMGFYLTEILTIWNHYTDQLDGIFEFSALSILDYATSLLNIKIFKNQR